MTRDPNKFISLKRNRKGKVTFGDNLSSKIIGKGTMVLRDKMKTGNVFLVKNLKPNILSVIQTCDQGYICIFNPTCNLKKRFRKTCQDYCKKSKKCVYSRK